MDGFAVITEPQVIDHLALSYNLFFLPVFYGYNTVKSWLSVNKYKTRNMPCTSMTCIYETASAASLLAVLFDAVSCSGMHRSRPQQLFNLSFKYFYYDSHIIAPVSLYTIISNLHDLVGQHRVRSEWAVATALLSWCLSCRETRIRQVPVCHHHIRYHRSYRKIMP